MSVAAAVLLAVGVATSWRSGGLRFTESGQRNYILSVAQHVSPALQPGIRQHMHCAVFRKHTGESAQEMTEQLGLRFAALLPAMQNHLPKGYRVVEGHRCHFQSREYWHLTATDGSHLISLLLTRRQDGEALEKNLAPARIAAGQPLYSDSTQRFNIAGFETPGYLIYLVSELAPGQNLNTFADMVPDVARTVRTSES